LKKKLSKLADKKEEQIVELKTSKEKVLEYLFNVINKMIEYAKVRNLECNTKDFIEVVFFMISFAEDDMLHDIAKIIKSGFNFNFRVQVGVKNILELTMQLKELGELINVGDNKKR